jgi:NAD(P)-dependent dehydrogenase (short-subunit alcohol dehydrogenase family)
VSFDLQLAGMRAMVTGGTRGLGEAVVQALVEAGVRVLAAAHSLPARIDACT